MPSKYVWIIDVDHTTPFGHPANDAGTTGPRVIPKGIAPYMTREWNLGHHFKMYDPHGSVCYVGRILVEPGREWGEEFYAPLDDFGAPNVGANRIDYYNPETKKWEEL